MYLTGSFSTYGEYGLLQMTEKEKQWVCLGITLDKKDEGTVVASFMTSMIFIIL